MSFPLRGFALLVAAGLFTFTGPEASAGELEQRLRAFEKPAAAPLRLASDEALSPELPSLDAVVHQDLALIEDFHPETDRWTDRNNRIRVALYTGAWLFSNELDIHHDVPVGVLLSWEVPGFISLRLSNAVVPWSRLEVKVNGNESRYMDGFVSNHTIGLGIFNPELSIEGLAFWAGFGGGLFVYNYDESEIVPGVGGDFQDMNITGHIFVELDYKITDVFHIGLGLKEHFVLADHTDEGRFYDLNGVNQSADTGRNDGILDDVALVTEITINLSLVF